MAFWKITGSIALVALFSKAQVPQRPGMLPVAGAFRAAGSLPQIRLGHTSTLLEDGRILIAGGSSYSGSFQDLRSAVLYDPRIERTIPVGDLIGERADHTATLLQDGRVLLIGGRLNEGPNGSPKALATAEIYDPSTMSFSRTGAMHEARDWHAAVRINDGRVLVCGGLKGEHAMRSAELYDPASGTFSRTGSMRAGRIGHTATLLRNGTVLVASEAFSEIYDPAAGKFSKAGKLNSPRVFHTATLLPDGKVLLVGGAVDNKPIATAEVYKPESRASVPIGSLTQPRRGHSATLLNDGRVLIAGGVGVTGEAIAETETLDPAQGTFHRSSLLLEARARHSATITPNGTLFLFGGRNIQAGETSWLASIEALVQPRQ